MVYRQYKLKDKKIKLYCYTETTDSMGQSIQQLTFVADLWAYYKQIGGSEYYEVKKIDSKENAMFVINHREDVTAHSILTYNDKVYEVTRVDDYEGYENDLQVYATWKQDKKASDIESEAVTPSAQDPEPDGEDLEEEDAETDD